MEGEQPASPQSVLLFGSVLIGALILYLVFVSNWYWSCGAQIDPVNLTPVECWKKSSPLCAHTIQHEGLGAFEQKVWPCFGTGNSTFDRAQFWGDDFVSRFFSATLSVAASMARPELTNDIIAVWNAIMKPDANRQALAWLLSAIYAGIVGTWVAKELYPLLRRTLD